MQDVVLRFMVHSVKELYPDLQEIDSLDELSQITISAPANSIVHAELVRELRDHGYTEDSGLYYLNPDPRSKLPTGLHKNDGPDDVRQMVSAHEEKMTKIHHLYLVNGSRSGSDCEALIP